MTTSPTEARVQALIEKIRIFARLRIQETKTAAGEDFRATEQHFDKLESALRAELWKDAERLDWLAQSVFISFSRHGCEHKVTAGYELRNHIDASIQQTKDTK